MSLSISRSVRYSRGADFRTVTFAAVGAPSNDIVGHKEIQFCSSESRKPVVLPLDHIWTVERPSFGEAESLDRALARSDYGAMDDASRVED